ncbi:30S ribosomal protein 2, chloroplastic [Impatiens glandulifera]|uniref:30S ribosomal protein 2, chloroplastic n=1 Tax=Impatiens glandulifera TaxID=253017 RepID=UPI001FB16338|nr:30S ribosomal protein 2, chloroplastic [Impatiens glandulifera]
MATISSILSPNLLQQNRPLIFSTTHNPISSKISFQRLISYPCQHLGLNPRELRRTTAVAEESPASTADPSSETSRKLYIGNIPRTVKNDELRKIVEEHGAVEKAEVMFDKYSGRSRRFGFVTMKTIDDANAAIDKLNGTKIGERSIKVNITEKPLSGFDKSSLLVEDSNFIDSQYKVYVGNLAKTVTSESLKGFFSDKGKAISAKVSRVPGTSKSTGFGFVTFSSEEDVDAAISSFNNAVLEGQKIRVNKA